MSRLLGPRFGVETAFILAVAAVAFMLELERRELLAALLAAWLVVAAFEVAHARLRPAGSAAAAEPEPARSEPDDAAELEPEPADSQPPAPVEVAPAPLEETEPPHEVGPEEGDEASDEAAPEPAPWSRSP